MNELTTVKKGELAAELTVPHLIAAAGDAATLRFLEFFAATIRNRGTRAVYAQAIGRFCRW